MQLSDASGSFTSAVNLTTTGTSTPLTATIPAGTASGTGYKVRVTNDNGGTAVTGSASTAFTIVNNPTVVLTGTTTQTIPAGANGTALGYTETPAATSRKWQYTTTSGSGYTDFSPAQTGTSYTPNFATAGTYYVVVTSTFPGCGAVTSNEAVITVTAPAPAPTITSFTPDNGLVGASVVITGTDFTGATAVTFNGTSAPGYTVNSATQITVTVPAGATTGPIAVTTPSGTATSTGNFTVNNPAPTLTSINPTSVVAGSSSFTLTATGSNFVSSSVINFNGSALTTTYVSASSLTATVPAAAIATAGSYPVTVTTPTPGGGTSATVTFTVAVPVPTISSFTPTTGSVGTVVTITGTNFTGATDVSFNGTAATTFSVTNATTISATVPTGATTGTISVTTPNGTATSTASFTVTGPVLATYALTTVNGNATQAPATATSANATATAIVRGNGISNSVSSSTGLYGAASWTSPVGSTLADAQTNGDYMAFSITPTAGYALNLSSVSINAYRTSAGPQTVELLVSTDGVAFSSPVSLGAQNPVTTSISGALYTFTAGSGVPQNVNGTLYFRLYGYAASGTGNFYLLQNGTTNGLTVYGTTDVVTTPSIYTGTISPAPVCAGSNLTVNYTTAGPAPTGSYSVELSNAAGSFTTPTALSTVSSTATSLTVTIPAATANGTGYRVRVVNSDGTIGSGSAIFTVQNASVSVAPATVQNLNTGVGAATLTGTETPAATSRQWAVSSTSGSGYAPINGATSLTYTPSFPAAGTYYVVLQSTFSACGTLTSNEVQINVTTPTLAATPTTLPAFTTSLGSTSAPQTYALTGTGLVSAVMVTAPAGFEVSLDGTTYAATVAAPAAAINTPSGQTIYVRLTGTLNSASGNVTNVVGSTSVSVAVSGTALTAAGVLLVEDDFDYLGPLTSNGWNGGNNSTTTITGNVTADQYPQGAQLAKGATSYQARLVGGSGAPGVISRTATIPNGTQTLYAAALINVSSTQNITGNDYMFSLLTSGSVSYRSRVTIKRGSSASKFTFGLRSSGESGATFEDTPTQFDVGTPYIMVLKAENSAATGNQDKYSLFVLPATSNLTQEPATPLITVALGSNVFSTLIGLAIRQADSNNPILSFDSFRLATGWGAAVGNPVYAGSPATINAGSYYSVTVDNQGTLTPAGKAILEGPLTLTSGVINTDAANQLLLYPTATTSGGGSTSYVNGPVQRLVGPVAAPLSLSFPVGKNAAYRPLTLNISAQTSTTTYTAEVKPGLPASSTLTGDLARVSRIRSYSITPDAQPTDFSGTVTLSFDADDQVTDPDASTLVIAKNDGSGWVNIGRSANTGTANSGAYVAGSLTSGTFTSFSDFALASTDAQNNTVNPLPVVLTRFTAQREGEAALVQWTTAQEKNSAYFEVQRSTNGYEFQPLGRVQAAGESTAQRHYAFRDATAPRGPVYYRLKQVDQDASVAFSEIRVLGAADAAATLYPNPVRDVLRVASATPVQNWRVLSLTGKALLSGTSLEAGCDVSRLPAGSYALELRTADGARRILRFVKE